jgi:hypothetical protein
MKWRLWVLVVGRWGVAGSLAVVSLLTELFRAHPRLVAVKLGLGGVLLSLSGLVAACGEKDDTAGDDDSYYWTCYTGPSQEIHAVSYGHDEDGWQYLVELLGWGDAVVLDIHGVPYGDQWTEQHDMVQGEYDPDGLWDSWVLDLTVVDDAAAQEAGLTTLFPADATTETTMTWRASWFEGDYLVDCVIWGADHAVLDDIGCRRIEAD